jgi:hypothetical protein
MFIGSVIHWSLVIKMARTGSVCSNYNFHCVVVHRSEQMFFFFLLQLFPSRLIICCFFYSCTRLFHYSACSYKVFLPSNFYLEKHWSSAVGGVALPGFCGSVFAECFPLPNLLSGSTLPLSLCQRTVFTDTVWLGGGGAVESCWRPYPTGV